MADAPLFEPTPKQAQFLSSNADIALMAGGAGSGKSYVMLWDALGVNDPRGPRISLPYYRGLLYRKQFAHLTELIDKSKQIYRQVDPGAVYTSGNNTWTFSSGAKILLRYYEDYDQVEQLQGQAYAWAGCDELGQYEDPRIMLYVISRLRSPEGLKCYFRATSNPSRYRWMRDFFRIDNIGTSTDFRVRLTLSSGAQTTQRIQYIQAMLKDNPYLAQDGAYEAKLLTMDEDERKALLEGRWDAYDDVKGLIYGEPMLTARKQGRICHVPYDECLDTHVYFDIGRNDLTTMIFTQRYGKEIRIIHTEFGNGTWIEPHLKTMLDSKIKIKRIVLPHDARSRHMESPFSTLELAQQYLGPHGIQVDCGKALEVEQGIGNVRKHFPNIWIDDRQTRFINDIESYKRKFDKRNQIYGGPEHDHTSHFADALRYVCQDDDFRDYSDLINVPHTPNAQVFSSQHDSLMGMFAGML